MRRLLAVVDRGCVLRLRSAVLCAAAAVVPGAVWRGPSGTYSDPAGGAPGGGHSTQRGAARSALRRPRRVRHESLRTICSRTELGRACGRRVLAPLDGAAAGLHDTGSADGGRALTAGADGSGSGQAFDLAREIPLRVCVCSEITSDEHASAELRPADRAASRRGATAGRSAPLLTRDLAEAL